MKLFFIFSTAIILFFSGPALFADEKKEAQPAAKQDMFNILVKRAKLNEKEARELKPILEELKQERLSTLKQLEANEDKALATVLKDPQKLRAAKRYLKMTTNQRGPRVKRANFERKKDTNPRKMPHSDARNYPKPPKTLPDKK